MKNLYKKSIVLVFLLLPLNAQAMKRSLWPASGFIKNSSPLVRPFRNNHPFLASVYSSRSLQTSLFPMTSKTIPNTQKTQGIPQEDPFKNVREKLGNKLIGPMIVGTGIGSYAFNRKKVHAQEKPQKNDKQLLDEILGCTSHESYRNLKLLKYRLMKDSQLAEQYIQCALKHIGKLSKQWQGPELVTMLISVDKNSYARFAQAIIKKFKTIEKISKNKTGFDFVLRMIRHNNTLSDHITNDDFTLHFHNIALEAFGKMITHDPIVQEFLRQLINSLNINKNKNIRDQWILAITNNMPLAFALDSAGLDDLIHTTLKNDTDCKQIDFAEAFFNYYVISLKKTDNRLIYYCIKKYPKIRKQFLKIVKENITTFDDFAHNAYLIPGTSVLITSDDKGDVTEYFSNLALEVFHTLDQKYDYYVHNNKKFDSFSQFINSLDILNKNETIKKQWLSTIAHNIPLALTIFSLQDLLFETLRKDTTDEYSAFARSILNQCIWHGKPQSRKLISLCIEKYPHLKGYFIKLVTDNLAQNWSKIPHQILALAHRYDPCNQHIKKHLDDHQESQTIDDIFKRLSFTTFCDKKECNRNYGDTSRNPSIIHIEKHFRVENNNQDSYFDLSDYIECFFSLDNPQIKSMVNAIIIKEQALGSDYYTFIHGQRRDYLLHEQLHTFLQNIRNGQKLDQDHLLLHVKEPLQNPQEIKQEKRLRNGLTKNGAADDYEKFKHLLFANWAYFANSNNLGSSSANYVSINRNAGILQLTFKELFQFNNLEYLYPHYQEQLEQLHQEFQQLTPYGTCMLIAIPKKTVNKQIYLAYGNGSKRALEIEGIGSTDDMSLIMETLTKNPEKIKDVDRIEFCIPMTYDKKGALNPESGIKIFAFNAAEQEKLDSYYAHQRKVFAEIQKDIEKNIIGKKRAEPSLHFSKFMENASLF